MTAASRLVPESLPYTVPGMNEQDAKSVIGLLQDRLNAFNDLALTLKHVHWNVVGPHVMTVHTMLDPQVDAVRAMADRTAERIATLGGSPVGTSGALAAARSWDDYALARADAIAHLGALNVVFDGVIDSHHAAIAAMETSDPVTQYMLIAQSAQLERFQWFVRAHLENGAGGLVTGTAHAEQTAARRARG